MQHIKISLPLKSFNLNHYTNLARSNKYASANTKKQVQKHINCQVREQLKEKIQTPCSIIATWQIKTRNMDLDNLLLKTILDELQSMQLLENDNAKHIVQITHKYEVNKIWQGVKVQFEKSEIE